MIIKLLPILTDEDKERFYKNVFNKSEDQCWPWLLSEDKDGYGQFHIKRKPSRAHRIAYFLAYGIDPKEMQVCHSCDNPRCCNPKHLFLGTNQDNAIDRRNKDRQIYPRNEEHPMSKFTNLEIINLRLEWRNNPKPYGRKTELAIKYGISLPHLINILNNEERKLD